MEFFCGTTVAPLYLRKICPKTCGRRLGLWACPTLRAGLRSRHLPSHFQESLQPSLLLPGATTSTRVLWGHYQVKWGPPEHMHTRYGDSCPSYVWGNSRVQTFINFFWIFNLIMNCHWLSATEFMKKESKGGGHDCNYASTWLSVRE